MFKENFVVCVKSSGKVLRENKGGIVELPFGSEYSLFLKNLSSRKAVASVFVDGKDVSEGNRIIVEGGRGVDILGFIEGNEVKNSFKFIERTKRIEEYRGINAEDGIIRVQFQFEKYVCEQYPVAYYYPYYYYPYYPYTYSEITYTSSSYNVSSSKGVRGTSNVSCYYQNTGLDKQSSNQDGITVKGSRTSQDFVNGYIGKLEENIYTITLKLVGYNKTGGQVSKAFYTNEKIRCFICGELNSSDHNYCSECGTFIK